MQQIEIRDDQADRLAALASALDDHAGPYASAETDDAVEFLLDLAAEVGDRAEGAEPETDAVSTAVDMAGVEIPTDGATTDDAESAAGDGEQSTDHEPSESDSAGDDPTATDADGESDAPADDAEGDEPDSDGVETGSAADGAAADDGGDVFDLLREHDDKWRKSGGDEPYEVDLPDGGTEHVRTRGDVKAILFKNYR